MYVTRRLSHYINHPESLSILPEGPNSGYLVLQDEDSDVVLCFGLCKSEYVMRLPFPGNKRFAVRDMRDNQSGVAFIPVLNQPLSSNQYYIINPHQSHIGEAYACSNHEDTGTTTCCSDFCIKDVYPRPLDPNDIYQQFEMTCHTTRYGNNARFTARSVVLDGIPPFFLQRSLAVYSTSSKDLVLDEALGLDSTLRTRLPNFDFPLSNENSKPIVIGKWYCPFVFIKDGALKDQIKGCMYYEMTLEQRWEQILACGQGNSLCADAEVQTEMAFISGLEATWDAKKVENGTIWFRTKNIIGGNKNIIGISSLIVDRMKWEVTRFGWVRGENGRAKVDLTEEFARVGRWSRFGFYVLVERFVLKRMDGSVAFRFDFKHCNLAKAKWE